MFEVWIRAESRAKEKLEESLKFFIYDHWRGQRIEVQEIDFVSPLGILFPVDQNWKIYNRDGARELNLEPDPSIAGFCEFFKTPTETIKN